jgi:Tfp pilus assembly protein PilX
MRGAFLILTLIALLIVGLLVVKNMESDMDDAEIQQMESIQKARETAREAEEQTREMQDRAREAARGLRQDP